MRGRLEEASEHITYSKLFELREAERAKMALGDFTTLQTDIRKARRRMRAQKKCLLDPKAIYLQLWDLLVVCCLLYTATVTPYEICFLPSEVPGVHGSSASW